MSAPTTPLTSRAQEVRTAFNADYITANLAAGKFLTDICRELGVDRRDVYRWVSDDAEFAAAMDEARDAGCEEIAEQAMKILDDQTEAPKSRQIRFAGRVKMLSFWHRKRYGEKLEVEQTNRNATLDMPADMPAEEAARRYQDWVRG